MRENCERKKNKQTNVTQPEWMGSLVILYFAAVGGGDVVALIAKRSTFESA